MSILPKRLLCASRPRRQIKVSAPGSVPPSICETSRRGMRASLSSENPAEMLMPPGYTVAAMIDKYAMTWPAVSLAEAHARLTAPGEPFETVETVVRGVRMRVWKHVPATAAEAFAGARGFGAREFLVHGRERVTYDGFSRASLRIARLLNESGLKKGDRLVLVMRNLPEWP